MLQSVPMRSIQLAALLLVILLPGMAQVQPGFGGPGTGQVTWYLSGVQFSDGGTATGWLQFNYSSLTCTVNITTTAGSASSGAHYTTCASATWMASAGSSATFWTQPSSTNLAGTPYLSIATSSVVANANTGGTLSLSGNYETTCASSAGVGCNSYAAPSRTIVAGNVSTTPPIPGTPAPPTMSLTLFGGALILCFWSLRLRERNRVSA